MYGITSEGTTTDLYTEFFGPRQPPPAPATAVATAQPVQPVAVQPVTPPPQNAAAPRSGRTATASRTSPQPAPQPAPVQSVQVAQQPAPPAPPPEPDAPTTYGIPSGGHTTDLYTAIFGPRRGDGQ